MITKKLHFSLFANGLGCVHQKKPTVIIARIGVARGGPGRPRPPKRSGKIAQPF